MTKIQKIFHVSFSFIFAAFMLLSPSFSLYAADKSNLGPQGNIGPQGTIGISGSIGPQGEIGPQESAASSSTSTQTNTNTGTDSTNTNTTSNTSATTVSTTNTSTVNNNIDLTANTGNTTVNNNTNVGQLSTGNVQGSVTVINAANNNLANGSSISTQDLSATNSNQITLQQSQNRTSLSTNDSTGTGSTNTNTTNGNNVVQLNTTNDATANTNYNVNVTTGNIDANQNTNLSGINTGRVDLGLTTINALNTGSPIELTVDVYNLPPGFNGNIVVPQLANTNTGTDSTNTNDTTIIRTTRESIINNSNVANVADLQTNTGGVIVGQNTQVGSITTGDTRVSGATVNVAAADTPVYYLVNVYGAWNGTLAGIDPKYIIIQDMTNTNTGADSTNTNTSSLTTDTKLMVTNNATATNQYHINADTGHINATSNTAVGNINTGGINISLNTLNLLNSTTNGLKKLAIGIINIFGNYSGTLSSTPVATEQTNTSATTSSSNAQVTQDSSGVHITMPSQDGSKSVNVDITHSSSTTATPALTPANPLKTMSIIKTAYSPAVKYVTQYITYYEPQVIEWDEQVPSLANALKANALEANAAKQIPHSFWYTLASGLGLVGLWGLSEYLTFRNKK